MKQWMKQWMKQCMVWGLAGWMGVATVALAEDGHDMHNMHGGHDMNHAKMDTPKSMGEGSQAFMATQEVDGYAVTFHVMQPAANMQHGGDHNLMIQIQKDGKAVEDALVNSKVFYPDDSSVSKMLMLMDGWYMNGYDLQEGRHGLMILFKTADGEKHKASVYYPE